MERAGSQVGEALAMLRGRAVRRCEQWPQQSCSEQISEAVVLKPRSHRPPLATVHVGDSQSSDPLLFTASAQRAMAAAPDANW